MRIEILRWRMAIPAREDDRIAVAYDVRVPVSDCPPNDSNQYILTSTGDEYQSYPHATWSTNLARGLARYKAWLDHEHQANRQMLDFLHEHCPETRELTEWPLLWTYVDPDLAGDLHTVHFIIPSPATTERTPTTGAAA